MKVRRVLLGTCLFTVALALLTTATLAWLLGTDSGARALWQGVSEAVVGLNAEAIEGRVIGPLALRGLRYENKSLRLSVDSIELEWSPQALWRRELLVENLHFNGVRYTQLQPTPPQEDAEPFELPERFSLPVAVQLRDIQLRSLEYRSAPQADPLAVDAAKLVASLFGNRLMVQELTARGPLFSLRAQARAQTADNYPLDATLQWQFEPADLAPLKGELLVRGDARALQLKQSIGAPYSLTQNIDLNDLTGNAHIDAQMNVEAADLRAIGEQLPQMNLSGELWAKGTLADITISTDLAAHSANTGNISVHANGKYREEVLVLEQLLLAQQPGGAQFMASGRVDLSGNATAGAASTASHPAPGPTIDLQGDWQDLRWPLQGDARITSKTGNITLRAALADKQLQLETLNVTAGSTQVVAKGALGDAMDFQFTVDSPNLGDLLPGASGKLRGEVRLGGGLPIPSLRASLDGQRLQFAQYQLNQLTLNADVDLQRSTPSQLDLGIQQASVNGLQISRLTLQGSGTRQAHELKLQADSSVGSAQLSVAGKLQGELQDSLNNARWEFALTAGQLQYAELAPWHLADVQAGRIDSNTQTIERGCWLSDTARLCLEGSRAVDDTQAAAELEQLPLHYFQSFLPGAVALQGTIAAQARWQQQQGAQPQAVVSLNTQAVQVRTGAETTEPDAVLLDMQPGSINLNYSANSLAADLSLPLTTGGGIDASLRVAAASEPLTERPLRGKLALAMDDIGFITLLSPEIEHAAGKLSTDVALSGSLESPVPTGELRLENGALQLTGPGLSIGDIELHMRNSGESQLRFEGEATSGDGTLALQGNAQLDGAHSSASIEIEGDRFQIFDTVDARVFVSPNLQLAIEETGIEINGEVHVPTAEITPQSLPASAQSASSDQVIITDEDDVSAIDAAQRELEAHIRVVLGEAVSVDGFGFKGRLTGDLQVDQVPGKPTLGSGELNILDGEYRAYGQGLVIERGKILFAGGPIGQPGINVRAVRRPADDILVGVSVRGPMQNPEFSVFSEPGMSQSQQLSWLVLGRPLHRTSEGEGNLIAQAALVLGLQGGNYLAERFGGGLGVDQVGIETGSGEAGAASDIDQAAFVIGKYLSPDLFVSYGIGLFEPISTIKLEYSLNENWKLSTESSTNASGGDVIYTIER